MADCDSFDFRGSFILMAEELQRRKDAVESLGPLPTLIKRIDRAALPRQEIPDEV